MVETNTKRFLLSITGIKLLALGLMLVDHLHYFFEFTGAIPLIFSMLGRMAGALFLFATVEGFSHTHNRRIYFLRIWLMGVGMGIVNLIIMLFLRRGDGFYTQNNIFATLTLLLIFWQGIDWLREKKPVKGLAALVLPIALTFATQLLPRSSMNVVFMLESTILPLPLMTEGGIPIFLEGIALYLLRKRRRLQISVWAAIVLLWNLSMGVIYGLPFGMLWITYHYEWMGVFAFIPMLMYNGERGRGLKGLFYAFYPAHVYILYALSCLVYQIKN